MEFMCEICSKVCKTKGGLTRHRASHVSRDSAACSNPSSSGGPSVFLCLVCNKKYLSAAGLRKHKKVHESGDVSQSPADTNPASVSSGILENKGVEVNCDSSVDSANFDVPDDDELYNVPESECVPTYFFEEDDEMNEYLQTLPLEGTTVSNKNKHALVKCSICGRSYKTLETYVRHKETHAMTDLYLQAPSAADVQSKSSEIVKRVLQEMATSNFTHGFGAVLIELARHLESAPTHSEEWSNVVSRILSGLSKTFESSNKYLAPSELREAFLRNSAQYSSKTSERTELLNLLVPSLGISSQVANIFLGTFIRKLTSALFAFFVHFMLDTVQDRASTVPISATFVLTTQPTDTLDFKQVMHYIGGANIKSILRTAFRIKNPNHEWLKVIDVVKKHFLNCALSDAPEEQLMAWTEALDRGGLTKINSEALQFFVELGATVKCMEHIDGSLFVNEVIHEVSCNLNLICLWDNILKGSLSREESFKLLHALCSYFCNTWRKGIVTRRLDNLSAINENVGAKHGQSGVDFRATLK